MKTTLLPLLGLALIYTAHAADEPKPAAKPKPLAALTVETAGQDYVDQGEYASDTGGVQVIALGDDKFRAVIYKVGLPGAGWDKSAKTEIEGKRAGEVITFTSATAGLTCSLAKGAFTIKSDQAGGGVMKKSIAPALRSARNRRKARSSYSTAPAPPPGRTARSMTAIF